MRRREEAVEEEGRAVAGRMGVDGADEGRAAAAGPSICG